MNTVGNTINVGDEYRTNPLSKIPGGHKIVVVLKNGFKLVYDKVKYPKRYAAAIHGDNVVEVLLLD